MRLKGCGIRMQIRVPEAISRHLWSCWNCCGTFIGKPYEPPNDVKSARQFKYSGCICNKCGEMYTMRIRRMKKPIEC